MEGDLPGEEEGESYPQETGNRKNLIGMLQRNMSLVPISNLFCKTKKIAEMFSIQKPGAEFVPSWLQKQPHVGLWPHFIPVTNDKVWNKPCQDVVSSWTSRHPCPEVYNRRNSLLSELIPTSFNDTHSKRG